MSVISFSFLFDDSMSYDKGNMRFNLEISRFSFVFTVEQCSSPKLIIEREQLMGDVTLVMLLSFFPRISVILNALLNFLCLEILIYKCSTLELN